MTTLLSHAPRYPDLAAALSANHARIDATPVSDAEKAELCALLDTLAGEPFWAYLIVNGGLNGDWTDYMIHRYRDDRLIAGMERFFTLPLQEATRSAMRISGRRSSSTSSRAYALPRSRAASCATCCRCRSRSRICDTSGAT